MDERATETVHSYAASLADAYGEDTAVSYLHPYRTEAYTYAGLYDQALRTATLLDRAGAGPGEPVILHGPNHPAWIVCFLACAAHGNPVVPVAPDASGAFKDRVRSDTGAEVTMGHADHHDVTYEDALRTDAPRVAPAAVDPDDPLEILYTSGSTADPKGVTITHRNVVSNIRQLKEHLDLSSEHRFLSVLPLSHVFEQVIGVFLPLRFNHTVTFTASHRSSQLRQAFHDHGITTMTAVPAFLSQLRDNIRSDLFVPDSLVRANSYAPSPVRNAMTWPLRHGFAPELQSFIVGGAALDEELERWWRGLGFDVLHGYGLTETSPVVASNTWTENRVGSVGKPLPEQHVRLGDHDEIEVAGPNVTPGYYEDSDATNDAFTEDGYFKTGDIGRFDSDGYLYIAGRKNNMVVTESGENVYPEDIESVLRQHDGVVDACVLNHDGLIGVITGEASTEAVRDAANRMLESHQRLTRVERWPGQDFPRTRTEKIRRDEVQSWLTRGEQRGAAGGEDLHRVLTRVGTQSPKDPGDGDIVVDAYGIDSVAQIKALDALETAYNTSLDDDALAPPTTIADLRDALESDAASEQLSPLRYAQPSLTKHAMQSVVDTWLTSSYEITVEGSVPEEPCLVVANHNSHLDTILLQHVARKQGQRVLAAGARDHFFSSTPRRCLADWLDVIPFDRQSSSRQSLQGVARLVDHGHTVLLFPEGTRGDSGVLKPFKQGIGVLAVESQQPVIPVWIEGTATAWPKNQAWPTMGSELAVTIGNPTRYGDAPSYDDATSRIEQAVHGLR